MKKTGIKKRIKELELELSNLKAGIFDTKPTIEASDAKFQNITNNISAHIAYVNADTLKYEFVNNLFEKSFGISRDKIIGSHIKNIIGEKNYKFALKYINEVKSGKTVSYENTFDITSGKRWIQVNYNPDFDSNNKVVGIAVVSYDITELKRLELSLSQQNSSLKKLNRFALELSNLPSIENLEAFIAKQVKEFSRAEVVTFAEYNPVNRTITPKYIESESRLLKKISRLLGKKVQNIQSVVSEDMYHEMTKDLIGFPKNLYEASFGEIPRSVGTTIQTLLNIDRFIGLAYIIEGELYGTSLLAMSKDQPDPPMEMLKNFIHMASTSLRRKRSDDKLIKSEEKLRELNSEKDRFIAILSHDLKNPFNGLLGLSELLAENIRKYDISEVEEFAISLNKTAQITYNLLEDLLLWARAHQDDIPFDPQIIFLKDICDNILEIQNVNAVAKHITINSIGERKIEVYADENMLKTVLRNLVSNAIKFTNNGGKIEISAIQTKSKVIVTISDNGIGMPPEILSNLFELKRNSSSIGTANEEGTGLGLLFCKEIVEKHGGEIWVESEVDKGSKLNFTLPVLN